jgi:hypothetical protein
MTGKRECDDMATDPFSMMSRKMMMISISEGIFCCVRYVKVPGCGRVQSLRTGSTQVYRTKFPSITPHQALLPTAMEIRHAATIPAKPSANHRFMTLVIPH